MGRSFAVWALAGLAAACVSQRELRVTSEPPGAQVRLDDTVVGTTPLACNFDHYGKRRITLHLDGFRTHTELVVLKPPWYARFPMDYVTELLVPVGWRDERRIHVVLEPGAEEMLLPDLASVLDRAKSLREAGPEGPVGFPEITVREVPESPSDEEQPPR